MSDSKNIKDDLLDLAMGITGKGDPIEITVGKHELTLSRNFTGQQVAAWQKAENDRDLAVAEMNRTMQDKSDEEVLAVIRKFEKRYAVEVFTAICVDTEKSAINGAAELISQLPPKPRTAVMRRAGIMAGLVDEEGKAIPFSWLSGEKTSTAD